MRTTLNKRNLNQQYNGDLLQVTSIDVYILFMKGCVELVLWHISGELGL